MFLITVVLPMDDAASYKESRSSGILTGSMPASYPHICDPRPSHDHIGWWSVFVRHSISERCGILIIACFDEFPTVYGFTMANLILNILG